MNNKYSLRGYRRAVEARTLKTVLVEGKDDKEMVDCLRLNWSDVPNTVVDTQDIFDDQSLSGLGAKAKIDRFLSQVPTASPANDKIRCLVDREWEELVDPNNADPLPWSTPILTKTRFKTSGHSIENYGFCLEFVIAYVKHFGGSVATTDFLTELGRAVPELLKAAAAFSEVVRKRNLITKCTNILDLSDIQWDGNTVLISKNIETKIQSRGAIYPVDLVSDFNANYRGKWAQAPLNDEAHLHCHGHIGEMIVWMGVGRVAVEKGVSTAIAEEIARGRKDEKRRVWHRWLSSLVPSNIHPVDKLLY